MARGFGVAGALPADLINTLAIAAEQAGYDSFWVNDTPAADSLERLAGAVAVTRRIQLGTGVIPVDRRPAEAIVARARELALPADRVIIGVGSGGMAGGLARVAAALPVLADLGLPIVVGALGPKMCRLAGSAADGLLLNWLTPPFATEAAGWASEAARAVGRPAPRRMTYARVALPAGVERARTEADRYAAIPAYANHFTRMGVAAVDTIIVGEAGAIQAALAAFEAVLDDVVARAITPTDSEAELMDLLRAAAPAATRPRP
ncbi:MAG: LLM class flavin-dependent oxidoreductase [Chloroflexi bacterium]|nr:LLM class flavin-dependent oxidoreductase [Chloroflexota bacterium]